MWPLKRKRSFTLRPSGRAFLVTAILVLLAAWNAGANLLYLVVGGMFSFLVLSWVLSAWTLARLRVSREGPEAIHRGESFGVTVRVENHKYLVPALSVRVEHNGRPGEALSYIPKIPSRKAGLVRVTEVFEKRGVYPLPQLDLVTRFPFGFLECRYRAADTKKSEVVVYPRVVALHTMALEQQRGGGHAPRVAKGDGDEFFSLRDYVAGDDMRRIAWRASARLGKLLVKELEYDMSRFVVFVFHTRVIEDLADFEERFEEAVELVASLAVTLLNRSYKVGIETPSGSLPIGEGKAQVINVLDMLARIAPVGASGPADLDMPVVATAEGPAVCVHVSPDPRTWGQGDALGGGSVLDPREVIRA